MIKVGTYPIFYQSCCLTGYVPCDMCPALGAVAVYLTIWQEHLAGTNGTSKLLKSDGNTNCGTQTLTTIDTTDKDTALLGTPWAT